MPELGLQGLLYFTCGRNLAHRSALKERREELLFRRDRELLVVASLFARRL